MKFDAVDKVQDECVNLLMCVDVRLAGSELHREGRLEVEVAGIWGTVRSRNFDDVDAGVACSMLGLGYESKRTSCWLYCFNPFQPSGTCHMATLRSV